MTQGETRVRIGENDNEITTQIKQRTAELMDLLDRETGGKQYANGEIPRLRALAQTAYEQAAMWAVKAVTTP